MSQPETLIGCLQCLGVVDTRFLSIFNLEWAAGRLPLRTFVMFCDISRQSDQLSIYCAAATFEVHVSLPYSDFLRVNHPSAVKFMGNWERMWKTGSRCKSNWQDWQGV